MKPMANWGAVRLLVGLAFLATLPSSAAPKPPSVERQIRQQVRSARDGLGSRDPEIRLSAVADLAVLTLQAWEPNSFREAIAALLNSIGAKDPQVVRGAAEALQVVFSRTDPWSGAADWATDTVDRQLRAALRDRDPATRLFACGYWLRGIDPLDPDARQTLLDLLDHRSPDTRARALETLATVARSLVLSGEDAIVERLRQVAGSADRRRGFDGALALWLVAQTLHDPQDLAVAEQGLVRTLVTGASADLDLLLDRFVAVAKEPPRLAPGGALTAALRRIGEEQTPQTAVRAHLALALLAPSGSDLGLTTALQRTLPGVLTHPDPGIRRIALEAIADHSAARLLATTFDMSETASIPAKAGPVRIAPPLCQALTNLFALPVSPLKLRALSQVCADAAFAETHAQFIAKALAEGLRSEAPEIVRSALAPGFIGAYQHPASATAREVLLSRLPDWDGPTAEAALPLLLQLAVTNLDRRAVVAVVNRQLTSPSPTVRLVAGRALVTWVQAKPSDDPSAQPSLRGSPRRFQKLAEDPHPAVAAVGVAGLTSAALNPDLGPVAEDARRRLTSLLEASDPAVRCRFVAIAQDANISRSRAAGGAPPPPLRYPPGNLESTRQLLSGLLQETDPHLREQVLRAFRKLGLEPPISLLGDPHACVRVAAVQACRPNRGAPLTSELQSALSNLLADVHPEVALHAAIALVPLSATSPPDDEANLEAAARTMVRHYRPLPAAHAALVRAVALSGSTIALDDLLALLGSRPSETEPVRTTALASLLLDTARMLNTTPALDSSAPRSRLARLALDHAQSDITGRRANGLLALGELLPALAALPEVGAAVLLEEGRPIVHLALRDDEAVVATAAALSLVRVRDPNTLPATPWSTAADQQSFLEAAAPLMDRRDRGLREAAASAVLALAAQLGLPESVDQAFALLVRSESAPSAPRHWEAAPVRTQWGCYVSLPPAPWPELLLWITFHQPGLQTPEQAAGRLIQLLAVGSYGTPWRITGAFERLDPESGSIEAMTAVVKGLIQLLGEEGARQWSARADLPPPGPETTRYLASRLLSTHLGTGNSPRFDQALVRSLELLASSSDLSERRSACGYLLRSLDSQRARLGPVLMPLLARLAADPEPTLRLAVLDWLNEQNAYNRRFTPAQNHGYAFARLNDPDPRVRQAAAVLLAKVPPAAWPDEPADTLLADLLRLLDRAEGDGIDGLLTLETPTAVLAIARELVETKGAGPLGEATFGAIFGRCVQSGDLALITEAAADLEARSAQLPGGLLKAHLLSCAANARFHLREFESAKALCRSAIAMDRDRITNARHIQAEINTLAKRSDPAVKRSPSK